MLDMDVTATVFHAAMSESLKAVAPLNALDKLVTVAGKVAGTSVRLVAPRKALLRLVRPVHPKEVTRVILSAFA